MLPMLAFSQQMPHYSLYMLNDVVVNPSLISTKSENQVALMIRNQWAGFEGAPKTQSISYYNMLQIQIVLENLEKVFLL